MSRKDKTLFDQLAEDPRQLATEEELQTAKKAGDVQDFINRTQVRRTSKLMPNGQRFFFHERIDEKEEDVLQEPVVAEGEPIILRIYDDEEIDLLTGDGSGEPCPPFSQEEKSFDPFGDLLAKIRQFNPYLGIVPRMGNTPSPEEMLGAFSDEEKVKGLRYNKGKPMMHLLPPELFESLGEMMTASLQKYPAHNWENGLTITGICDSLIRHYVEFMKGNDVCDDYGLLTVDHILWNAMALCVHVRRNIGHDDRFRYWELNKEKDDGSEEK